MEAWNPVNPSTTGLRFTRKGYGRLVRADGTLVSRHVSAEEAYERASLESQTCTYHPPPIEITRVIIAALQEGVIDGGGSL